MAKIPEGILGGLIGKVGPVTGYRRNGEYFIRSAGRHRDKNNTPARMAQRQKIKVCNDFTKAFSGTGFFSKSFPSYGDTGTGYNRATSAIMNLAVTGSYPHTVISYPLVLISKGPLPGAENAAASVNTERNISFSWTDNSVTGTAKANDKAVLVAYFPEIGQGAYSIGTATRGDMNATLITSQMRGIIAETWMGFLSDDEKNAANSFYTGRVEI